MELDAKAISELIRYKKATIKWLGQSGREGRERFVLRAFLRCLKIKFNATKIKSIKGRFPDVEFRNAEFEIKEMLDPNRKRHQEYKNALEKLKTVRKFKDLVKPYRPNYVTFDEVAHRIERKLGDLCRKYPENQRSKTNLLIYFNLQGVMLDTKEPWVPVTLKRKGWQSVSVVGSSWCYIFDASNEAPMFLKNNVGRFCQNTGLWD